MQIHEDNGKNMPAGFWARFDLHSEYAVCGATMITNQQSDLTPELVMFYARDPLLSEQKKQFEIAERELRRVMPPKSFCNSLARAEQMLYRRRCQMLATAQQ